MNWRVRGSRFLTTAEDLAEEGADAGDGADDDIDDALAELAEQAGLGRRRDSAARDQRGQAVARDFVAGAELGVALAGSEGEALEDLLVAADVLLERGLVDDHVGAHEAAASEDARVVVDVD